jgi:hypothetical protein
VCCLLPLRRSRRRKSRVAQPIGPSIAPTHTRGGTLGITDHTDPSTR